MSRRGRGLTREEFVHSHPARVQLLDEIRRHPGLGLSDLAGRINQAYSSTKWHLHVLLRHRLIEVHLGPGGRYYTAALLMPDTLRIVQLYVKTRRRGWPVLVLLASSGPLTASMVVDKLGLAPSTVRRTLDNLVASGLASGPVRESYAISSLGQRVVKVSKS